MQRLNKALLAAASLLALLGGCATNTSAPTSEVLVAPPRHLPPQSLRRALARPAAKARKGGNVALDIDKFDVRAENKVCMQTGKPTFFLFPEGEEFKSVSLEGGDLAGEVIPSYAGNRVSVLVTLFEPVPEVPTGMFAVTTSGPGFPYIFRLARCAPSHRVVNITGRLDAASAAAEEIRDNVLEELRPVGDAVPLTVVAPKGGLPSWARDLRPWKDSEKTVVDLGPVTDVPALFIGRKGEGMVRYFAFEYPGEYGPSTALVIDAPVDRLVLRNGTSEVGIIDKATAASGRS